MRIRWYGMASFLIESSKGVRILTDPYEIATGYRTPFAVPDIVTVSHNHFDHNAVETVKGEPLIIEGAGSFEKKGIKFTGVKTFHDNKEGKERGGNTAFLIEMDNISFVHLGDIGHTLNSVLIRDLRPCDILALPVGGFFTVDGDKAFEITEQLKPSLVIPMHFSTPSCLLDLDTPEKFLLRFPEVKRVKEWEGKRSDLPRRIQVLVMMAGGEKDIGYIN